MSSTNTYNIMIIYNDQIIREASFNRELLNDSIGNINTIVDQFKKLLDFDITNKFISDSIYNEHFWKVRISSKELKHLRNSQIDDILK